MRLAGSRHPAVLELSLAEGGGARPLVLMSPPSQGIFAARYLAGRYARRGVHAAVIVPDGYFLEPGLEPAALEAKMRQAVVQARTVVAVLASREDVAGVSYLGISAGGIFGVVLLAVEPTIERSALVFPGGDLPTLIATSDESTVVAYRQSWSDHGVGAGELAAEVARAVRTEPLALARHVDPRKVLLFLSAGDTKVPIAAGFEVEAAMGFPQTWLLAGNHQTSGLCFGFVLREVDEFLLPGPGPTGSSWSLAASGGTGSGSRPR